MDELAAIERDLDEARERDDNRARIRLVPCALALPAAQPHLAEHLDELAYAFQQLGRLDDAIDAMRRALAVGFDGDLDDHPSAQALIADLLLRAGRTQEADDAWIEAEREDPHDPWLHLAAGRAYAEVGSHSRALEWQTKGLELALADGGEDADTIWLLAEGRAETLGAPDDLRLRAEALLEREEQAERARDEAFLPSLGGAGPVARYKAYAGVAWFPAGQYERALDTWPSFAEDYDNGPYSAYCAAGAAAARAQDAGCRAARAHADRGG